MNVYLRTIAQPSTQKERGCNALSRLCTGVSLSLGSLYNCTAQSGVQKADIPIVQPVMPTVGGFPAQVAASVPLC